MIRILLAVAALAWAGSAGAQTLTICQDGTAGVACFLDLAMQACGRHRHNIPLMICTEGLIPGVTQACDDGFRWDPGFEDCAQVDAEYQKSAAAIEAKRQADARAADRALVRRWLERRGR